MAQYELNLRDYTRILRKRMFLIIFSAVMLGFFSFFFANMKKPVPRYRSTASVKVEQSTTMAGLYIESISWSEGDALETQSAIIKSLPVMERVAKEMNKIDKELTSEVIRADSKLLNIVLGLKSKISTSVEGDTNIINISAISRDPKFAANLANVVAKVFMQVDIEEKNRRTIEAKRFIETRLKLVYKRLQGSQGKLKALREERRFVSMEMLARKTLNRLEEAEMKHKEIKGRIETIDGLIEHLDIQKTMPNEDAEGFYSEKISPIFSSLNKSLNNVQSKRNILLVDYTDIHPDIIRLDKEIENLTNNMRNHLASERIKLKKIMDFATEVMKKEEKEYHALPEVSFQVTDIETEIKTDQFLYSELKGKYQEVLIKEAEKIQDITIVRPALESHTSVNPATTGTTTVVGIIIGLILGVVVAFVRETLDTSIGTIDDVEEFLGVSVLGIIPHMDSGEIKDRLLKGSATEQSDEVLEMNARLVSHFAPKSTMAESFRALRTGVEFVINERKCKCMGFTSSTMGEGKTTVTCNFAMTLAQIGKKVLLIDGDLRKPMVDKIFGIEREPGLSDVILGNYNWEEVIKTDVDIMMGKMGMEDITTTAPGINNLNIITAGLIPPNSAELLSSSKMSEILAEMKEAYDIVVVDSSPVLPSTDAIILASKLDGVCIVYKVGQVARGALKRAKTQIDSAKATVLGVVLNSLKPETGSDYRDYGYYGYTYSYGAGQTKLPWYKRLFECPEIIKNIINIVKKKKEDVQEFVKKEDGHSEEGKWYNIRGKISNILNKFSTNVRKNDAENAPDSGGKGESFRKTFLKIWFKVTILIFALTFILLGLLWQFGIIR